jgi:predicted Zn finger-like uncharacterized protein
MIRCPCPSCEAVLKLPDDTPAGKKVKCPQCQNTFPMPELDEEPVAVAAARRPAEPADEEEDYDPEPRPRRRRRRAEPQGMKPATLALIIVPCVVGVVALLVGGILFAYSRMNREPEDKNIAKGGGPNANNTLVQGPTGVQGPGLNPQNPQGPQGNQPKAAPSPLDVGKVAPEIEGEDIDGKRFRLSDYRGKVVVIDFWGHW